MKRIRNALNLLGMSSKMKESNGLGTVDIPSDAHNTANYSVDSDVGNENASSKPIPYATNDTAEHKSPILASKNMNEQNAYLVKETQYVQGLDEKYQLPPPTISKPTSWDTDSVVPSAICGSLQPTKAINQSNLDVAPTKRRQFPPPPPPIRSSSVRTIKKASTHTKNVQEEQPSSSSHPTNPLIELKSELLVHEDEKDAVINAKEGKSTSSPQMRNKVDQKQSMVVNNDQAMLISQQMISGNHITAGKPKIVGLIHKTDITHSNPLAGQSGEANCISNETINKDSALSKNSSQDPVLPQSTSLVEQENQHQNYKKFLTQTHVKNEECSTQQTKPYAVDKNCSDKVQTTLMDELSKVTKRIANAQNKLKTGEDAFSQYDKGQTVSNSRLKPRDTSFAKPVSQADLIKSESVTNSYKSHEKHSKVVLPQKHAVEDNNQAIQPIARAKEDVNVFETAETQKFASKTRHDPKLPLSNRETTAIPSESENLGDQGIQFVARAENRTNADLEHDNVAPEHKTPQNLLLSELKKRNAAIVSSSSTKEHDENTIQRDPVVLPSKSVDSIKTQGEKTNDLASRAAKPNEQMAANTVSRPVIPPKPSKKNKSMDAAPSNPPAVETGNTAKDKQTYRPTPAPKPLPRRIVPTANNSSAKPQAMSAQGSGARHIVADSTDQVTVKINVKDGISDEKKMLEVQGCDLSAIQTTNTDNVDTADFDEILAKLNEELNLLDELCKQSFAKKENE